MERRIMEADVETLRKVVQELSEWAEKGLARRRDNEDFDKEFNEGLTSGMTHVCNVLSNGIGRKQYSTLHDFFRSSVPGESIKLVNEEGGFIRVENTYNVNNPWRIKCALGAMNRMFYMNVSTPETILEFCGVYGFNILVNTDTED